MGSILEVSILHHVGLVFVVIWLFNVYNCCGSVVYLIAFIYLFLVHERYVIRLRKKVEFEEKRNSNQRRVLSDSETVRWLNYAVEKMWTVCLEEIVSQKILLPIIPWFLQKYKPWTVREVEVQQLYLGRSPPMFTEMRVLHQSNDDDHLVFELGMNFRTADDMSALMAVKLRKRLGFGMWAKLHLLGMHIEGKVLIGVKFLSKWPFIARVRLCFAEPPYFQMTVKPIFTHGLDVTELPGIAGWLDKLLSIVFEQTLVEPNMLVVDVQKLVSPQPDNWFSIDEKQPVAYVLVEVIEAADMKPSDLNGLADPYVKGQLGPYRFRTKIQKKTLAPKWHEEFKIPICTWEPPNILAIEVRDKDHFVDDKLGECSIDISDFRDGQRHDLWLSLQNVKVGRLHVAMTVVEGNGKVTDQACDEEDLDQYKRESFATDTSNKGSFSSATSEKSPTVADKFDPIYVEGQQETGIWVHRPGSEVAQVWEPRKGKSRRLDTEIQSECADSGSFKSKASEPLTNGGRNADESLDAERAHSPNRVQRGFQKIGSIFHRRHRNEEKTNSPEVPIPSPHVNLRSVNSKEIGVKFIIDDTAAAAVKTPKTDGRGSSEGSEPDSPHKGNAKDVAKNILRQAGKSARDLKHAISRKGSRKFKSDSGERPTERDDSVASHSSSSEEESVTSPVGAIGVEAIPVPSEPASGRSTVSSNSSEPRVLSPAKNIVINPEEPVNRSPGASKVKDDDTSGHNEKTGPAESNHELPDADLAVQKNI